MKKEQITVTNNSVCNSAENKGLEGKGMKRRLLHFKKRMVPAVSGVLMGVMLMSTTCFAAGTGTSAVTQPLENLKTLIIAVIGACLLYTSRVAYDGIEIAMKVGSGGIAAMQKAIDFLKGMLDYEKSLGKTSMRKLLLKGGDLQVLQFNTEDMKKVEKMAKKYGILYSVLPDCNRKDGLSEVIFHTEAVPRVNMMIQKLKFGKIATFDDYLKNGDEKSLGKLMDFLKKQQGNEKSHTIEGLSLIHILLS